MPALPRRRSLLPPRLNERACAAFVLATLLLLLAAPLAGLPFRVPVSGPLQVAGWTLGLLAAAWAVCARVARFFWLLLPAFLALPVELFLLAGFHQHLSPHHLGVIVETSPGEALEFLGRRVWPVALVGVSMLAWFGFAWYCACRTRRLDWRGPSRPVALLALACAGALWCANDFATAETATVSRTDAKAPPARATVAAGPLPAWLRPEVDLAVIARTWPFGVLIHGHEFWRERLYLRRLADESRAFRFGATSGPQASAAQTVVLVLGESSRYDRWGINGYARQTTPLLAAQANLVSLSDLITGVSATRLSVPVIMSRKPVRQSLHAGFNERSLISAYREAGFKTWWLSNQMSFGKFDTPVSVFADEADVRQFTNLGGLRRHNGNKGGFDASLFEPLERALRDPAPRKLVVLHTLGNHWNYSQRYPQSFDRWQPSLFGVDSPAYTDLRLKEAINNSYDNSILYTDWFLSELIGRLDRGDHPGTNGEAGGAGAAGERSGEPAPVSLLYVADHGQTLYDGACRIAFHGHNTQHEFHVPAMVWYSDRYRALYPGKVEQLGRHRQARLSTENIFHSMLDMADVRYPGEQLERSFFSERLRPHRRLVDSYGWTDYDNADMKGDCREVIGREKPLPRQP
jgi:glucan phosphoethanolaminetransferase (alkaline phosphatase superfamily)